MTDDIEIIIAKKLQKESKTVDRKKVLSRAMEVFECQEDAVIKWMSSPLFALSGMTPNETLQKENGEELVLRLLGRIEHGVPS